MMNPSTNSTDPAVPRTDIPPRLLTVREACEELRVGRWTLNQLIQSRRLTTIKIGSRRLIPTQAISTFIEQSIEKEDA